MNSAEAEKFVRDHESHSDQSISSCLIQFMLCSKYHKYTNCELLMQAITAAALRFGVESIVETLVSQYEYRFGPKRTVNEETAHDEMVVLYISTGQI